MPTDPVIPLVARRLRAAAPSARRCGAVVTLVLFGPRVPARAQTGKAQTANTANTAPSQFSLADALAAVRGSHPSLRAAGGRRQAAVGTARQDAAFFNPVVEYRRENIGGPVAPDEFAIVSLGADAYSRRYALRGLVGSVGARAAADSVTAGRAVEFDVARAYWRAALAVALRDAAEEQQRAVDSLAAVQARRAREGAVAEGASLRTQVEADRVRLAAASAQADAERAHADLARALALPFDRVPWPTDGLDLPSAAVAAVRPAAFAPSGVAPNAVAAPGVDSLTALALRQRPELVAARARLDETQRRQRAERLGALPGIGAVGGYKRTAGYNTGVAGVFVSVPLFDRNQGARARSEGDQIAAENDLRALEAQVSAEVVGAVRAYQTLVAAGPPGGASAARTLDARGRDVAAVTELAYREGAATLLELLDAVRSREAGRAAALRWAADLQLARLDVERATGAAVPAPTGPGATRPGATGPVPAAGGSPGAR